MIVQRPAVPISTVLIFEVWASARRKIRMGSLKQRLAGASGRDGMKDKHKKEHAETEQEQRPQTAIRKRGDLPAPAPVNARDAAPGQRLRL